MSIAHLEDLPLADFLKVVRNISTFHASEKLDGANLWMGLDGDGKLFTSREGKSKRSSRFFSESEYPKFAAYNGFRAAHAALEAKVDDIRRVMQPNQMVELEILYGRQPNAVTYGADDKSYIAFLRGVDGTPDVVADQLSMSLGGTSVKVSVEIIETSDGETVDTTNRDITWQFTGAQKIDPSKLKDVDLSKQISALEKYLNEPSGVNDLTNNDLLNTSLGSIKMDVRDDAKTKKSAIIATIMTDFRLPIKKELLDNYVRKIKPALSASDLSDNEDLGVEGIVLRDPDNSNLVKLVDKDAFTTINAFNHAIRNQVSNVIKTTDPDAPLEARGGVIGDMKIKIADLLGNADLARGGTAKRAFAAAKGATPVETVKNFSKNLQIDDFLGTKRKMLALVQQAAVNLRNLLNDFKQNKEAFQLKLKNGKQIGISTEIEKRTLLVFAETRRNIEELFAKLQKAKTTAQVIATLYGHLAADVHSEKEDPPVVESVVPTAEDLLLEKKYDTDKRRYANKDAFTIINIYFATVFMAAIMYQANDRKGILMLKDKTHYRMTSWSKDMSALNFWGYPIWRASQPAVKKLVGNKVAQDIFKITRRAAPSQSRFLHMDLSYGRDVPIEWRDHAKTMRILQQFDGMNTDRINILMNGVFTYETSTRDQQVKTLARLFFYVNQFIPTSPLFLRIKAIQHELLMNANGENDLMAQDTSLLTSVNSLVEDEDPSVGGDVQSQGSQVTLATKAADANPSPEGGSVMQIRKRKTEKRKRNPAIKRAKFPKPEDATV